LKLIQFCDHKTAEKITVINMLGVGRATWRLGLPKARYGDLIPGHLRGRITKHSHGGISPKRVKHAN
jgi:hypothetical protein